MDRRAAYSVQLLIYGLVMIFLPQSYTVVASSRVEEEIRLLTESLAQTDYADAPKVIESFCYKNQAVVSVSGSGETLSFGSIDDQALEDNEMLTSTGEVCFADRDVIYYLSIVVPVSARNELTTAFYKAAAVTAGNHPADFSIRRLSVQPGTGTSCMKISRVSKRMANLDMTWECKANRTDELGVLANSLNTMAKQLDAAMKALESANQKLREDMEHITELSRQRRDFFAAASHELKTPITILKGQIESMILGIGKYKDTDKVLPETLREVENMEQLVREILTISKIEMDGLAGKSDTVSLSDTLAKIAEILLPLARERQITVHSQLARNVTVSGNASLLEKAVHNILATLSVTHRKGQRFLSVLRLQI